MDLEPVVYRSDQVIAPPVVLDLDGVSVPEIVFASFPPDARDASAHADDGTLRAIHGDGTGELFAVTDPTLDLRPDIRLAAGDIDGDGIVPDNLGIDETSTHLLAFAHDGRLAWRSQPVQTQHVGAPVIADIDRDGTPEIVVGTTVLNATGTVRWTVPFVASGYGGGRGRPTPTRWPRTSTCPAVSR